MTGYRGRIGLYELLELDEGMTDAVRRSDLAEFERLAHLSEDFVPLVQVGLNYAAEGTTSVEEIMRICSGLEPAVVGEVPDPLMADLQNEQQLQQPA